MKLLFIKLHLIIFEVISLILLCSIFLSLFYYSVIFKNMNGMKEENIGTLCVNFTANFSKGIFGDVDIKLFKQNSQEIHQNSLNACILYAKTKYKDKNNEEIIKEISDAHPNNIFLFENKNISKNFKYRLLNLKTECSTFNLTLFTLISLFLIFIKITLLKDSIVRLKKIKSSKSDGKNEVYTNLLAQIHPEEYALTNDKEDQKNIYYNPVLSFLNPINVYYYVIFHLTIVIIIPLIFPDFIEFHVRSYFGFTSNMYYSVYYGRSLFGTDRLTRNNNVNLKNLIVPENIDENTSKLFMVHSYLDLKSYVPTNLNPYMINLLIMCGSIWLSQLFHPFDSQTSVKIVDVDLKKGKFKKYIKIASIAAVFIIWGFFIMKGFIYQLDLFYLYLRLFLVNPRKLFDLKIPIFLFVFSYHFFFYIIMGIYTYQTYQKNKKYEGNQKIDYKWFS